MPNHKRSHLIIVPTNERFFAALLTFSGCQIKTMSQIFAHCTKIALSLSLLFLCKILCKLLREEQWALLFSLSLTVSTFLYPGRPRHWRHKRSSRWAEREMKWCLPHDPGSRKWPCNEETFKKTRHGTLPVKSISVKADDDTKRLRTSIF